MDAAAPSASELAEAVTEHITITDNAIIPLKERVVDEYYDPLRRLFRIFQ